MTAHSRFPRKTGRLYLCAVLRYLPVNLYAGHFAGPKAPPARCGISNEILSRLAARLERVCPG